MRVEQLWRYPVKSIGGEPLDAVTVGAFGIEGDRAVAVQDAEGEVTWAGAIPGLMRVTASTAGPGVATLLLPDGARVRTDAPDASDLLGAAVGAPVRLVPHPPSHDVAALHVLTTASLRTLGAALPDSAVDVTRFRANVVLDVDGDGCPEQSWIGRRMAVGGVVLRFTQGCDRCVMITKETPSVPHDRAVLRWVAREFGNAFGVYAAVETPGAVAVGDAARLL
jgi:uncharacterized protein YcbX